ncbi:hypothetical protein N665_4743s0001 [Sinapis alba]|nr:hypothetical protein N665_4743s0001 [Sinapis alba]
MLLSQVGSRPLTIPRNRIHLGIFGGLLVPTFDAFDVLFLIPIVAIWFPSLLGLAESSSEWMGPKTSPEHVPLCLGEARPKRIFLLRKEKLVATVLGDPFFFLGGDGFVYPGGP